MKKFLFVTLMTIMTVTLSANDDDVTQNGLTKQVVVNKNQPTTKSQSKSKDTKQQSSVKNNSNFGLYNGLGGTLLTFKGFAPYEVQPIENCYWPRFGIQIGAGYAKSYFTYEALVEYMQTNIRYPEEEPEYLNTLMGSARIGGMLPIQLGKSVFLIPNVKGQLGGVFSLNNLYASRFQVSIIGGLDFGFRFGKSTIALGFVYEYRWMVDNTSVLGFGLMGGQLAFVF